MKQFSIILAAGLLSLAATSALVAQEKMAMKEVTVTGEIIDTKCYLTGMMGGQGEDHKQCAIDCIKGGLPVDILEDKTEKVYSIVPKKGMTGANVDTAITKLIAQKAKLTGMFIEKGGTKMFVYTGVQETK